jgi:hypothetical protein
MQACSARKLASALINGILFRTHEDSPLGHLLITSCHFGEDCHRFHSMGWGRVTMRSSTYRRLALYRFLICEGFRPALVFTFQPTPQFQIQLHSRVMHSTFTGTFLLAPLALARLLVEPFADAAAAKRTKICSALSRLRLAPLSNDLD